MPSTELNIFCPAKINIFLEITGKLPNGYHELSTLFAKLKFGDNITLTLTPSEQVKINFKITGPLSAQLEADENNLVYKAAERFFEKFNIKATADITLEKNIPMGAGLGGGSSDAGSLLNALTKHYNINRDDVLPIATTLGADVPLFLYDEPILKGEGIGDKLTPVKPKGALPYVILAYPNEHVSTKDVYGRVKVAPKEEILTSLTKLDKMIKCFMQNATLETWQNLLFNRLEEFVLPYSKKVSDLKFFIQTHGSGAVLMSGSGSTVFAFLEDKRSLQDLEVKLKRQSIMCITTQLWEGLYEDNGNQDSLKR
ncbi:4-diphosphocytidyl-2-C-methyl-D-erythritol kinase [Elusimicrobium posterum]|uniref:4-(cytidine 5'-diphospho)-2-C-methyl-D-erythritol kinase n=1 Tax=Elusimicrobium posterum TaxID=3116653 RepID=UPI003C739622